MNGGVLHAVETLTDDERRRAIAGYNYFGLGGAGAVFDEVANEIETAPDDDLEALEVSADERYDALVPNDETLTQAFEVRLSAMPTDFEAVI